ncbi:MAG: DEAD/DEAH box helicase family protein [Chloroflexota bacterium]|nr:DEAD/DEAH box helicase family protein [Chloroflexota bacterium]
MVSFTLSDHQLALVDRPTGSKIFLEGPAGTGKTTAGVAWLLYLLESGVPASSILVIVPQRTLATPYYEALRHPTVRPGGQVTVATVGGLAQRMVDLFWPLVAEEAGFGHPDRPPTFLTLETAQYYMARLVRPLLDQGYFETVVIDRNRLYSQIVDNLNKAAVVGFPHTLIGERLKAAWGGEQSQRRIYDEAQDCVNRFREHCLAHNLLDFSLQLEVFTNYLWSLPTRREYLLTTCTHLIVDNVEEDTPVAHDILEEWLNHCQSALLITDHDAGYRRFLGADPENARALRELCPERFVFTESFVTSPDLRALGAELSRSLNRPAGTGESNLQSPISNLQDMGMALTYEYHRYHPQMLDWVADEIAGLVREGVPPGEIVVLAPFLTDALRFSLTNRLAQHQVPARSHRPSRALREEPATRCLLTLAAVAHPEWAICPSRFDVAYALMQAIGGMDLVRAQLLTEIVYRVRDDAPTLSSFDQINPKMQERLTFVLGRRYERLRAWIAEYAVTSSPSPVGEVVELDHFLSRLFGEVLSQDGYGFHRDYDAGQVAANLIESAQKFRWAAGETRVFPKSPVSLGQEYLEMVQDGVVASQYIRGWRLQPEDAVLLAPAYTFLMNNRPVGYQFWLNVGGRGWWERLYQPLTHPYVLSRRWDQEAVWTDGDEIETRQDALHRLILGLIRRCRYKVYLGLSELGEQGYEQKGPLLHAIQRVLRRQGG